MYTIVGIEKREGTYEGRDYSNVYKAFDLIRGRR